MTAAADSRDSSGSADNFRLTFLGKQAINRPTNTGFGSVQKPLRDVYMACTAAGSDAAGGGDRLSERTVQFDGHDMQIRFWDPGARRFQQEVWPIDCVTYLDLVHFHTVKGKKRQFAYFRRHTDSVEVAPDSVLIPLHKKEARALAKRPHRPLLCFLIRRPHGIQFLECHAYQVESETEGLAFIAAFDRHSRAKLQGEKRSDVFNYAPWQSALQPGGSHSSGGGGGGSHGSAINKWSSQPVLVKPSAALGIQHQQYQQQHQMTAASVSDMTAPPGDHRQRMYQSSDSVAARVKPAAAPPVPSAGGQLQTAAPMRRSASGTIFDKYKELQAFNIPESEYMGFQEMQQQVEVLREQKLQQHQQPQPPEPATPATRQQLQHHQSLRDHQFLQPQISIASSCNKFPSEGNIHQRVQQPHQLQQLRQLQQPHQQQEQQTPAIAPRRLKAHAEQNRPSTILEDLMETAAGGGRHSQLPARDVATPGDSSDPAAGASSVASLVNRFERARTDVARPVARVPPTPVRPPGGRFQGSDVADKAKSPATNNSDQHRIHRQASSRLPQELHAVSTPDFVASGLGYLP